MNPELKIPEFKGRNYATTDDYPDEFAVKVVDPVEAQQARREWIPGPMVSDDLHHLDDGVRLNTPEAHRLKAIEEIEAAATTAVRHAAKARGWAAAINYHDDVKDKLSEAIETLNEAVDLLGVHEE